MLKDFLKKTISKKEDKLRFPVMDGFVEITGYDKDGKEFYHDYGDNVVTDWMRHAIMCLLCGVAYGKEGDSPNWEEHNENKNPDAYIGNGAQFLAKGPQEITKYCKSTNESNKNAIFPTKILLGTGKEYHDWDTLKKENSEVNKEWYNEMVALFSKGEEGDEATAKSNFNNGISNEENKMSGTIVGDVTDGKGMLLQCRSVNDPISSKTNVASSTSMYKNYNVIGAIKTPYKGTANNDMLISTVTDSGKLLKAEHRGVGKPCFIYFDQTTEDGKEQWQNEASNVKLSYDSTNGYLTKITFTVILPAQTAAEEAAGLYYPYNGFQLKQIGLYNDAKLVLTPGATPSESDVNYYSFTNMSYGMLLAVKNITPVIKAADASYKMKWTLTI